MARLSLHIHGVPALDVYKWFSCSASEARQKQKVGEMLGSLAFPCINRVYYIGSQAQLHQFIKMLKPQARNGETAEQLRNRFYSEHAYLLVELPEVSTAGNKSDFQDVLWPVAFSAVSRRASGCAHTLLSKG